MYSTSPRCLRQATDTLQNGDSPVPKRQRLLTDSTGKDEAADVSTSLQINDEAVGPSAPAAFQLDVPSSNTATTQHARATMSPMVDEARVLSQSLCLITHHTDGCNWTIIHRKQASSMACWKHISIQHQQFPHLAQIAKSFCMLHSVPADLPVGQKLPTCICMLQMPKLVPLEWAAVHQVMSSHEVLMSTSPDAWRALVSVWSAMSAQCTPDKLLGHIEQLALALSSKAALPGWTKLDFPAGLMMAMALLTTR